MPGDGYVAVRCYFKTSTAAYGSADCGRKRLMVNFVG